MLANIAATDLIFSIQPSIAIPISGKIIVRIPDAFTMDPITSFFLFLINYFLKVIVNFFFYIGTDCLIGSALSAS